MKTQKLMLLAAMLCCVLFSSFKVDSKLKKGLVMSKSAPQKQSTVQVSDGMVTFKVPPAESIYLYWDITLTNGSNTYYFNTYSNYFSRNGNNWILGSVPDGTYTVTIQNQTSPAAPELFDGTSVYTQISTGWAYTDLENDVNTDNDNIVLQAETLNGTGIDLAIWPHN